MTTKSAAARIVPATLVVLTSALFSVALSDADGDPGNRQPAAPLSLVAEYVWNSPNPAAPTWCLNEDDYHQRTWSGSLSGSFTATEQLCGESADYSGGIYWDAGGIGLQADLYVVGALSELMITSPQGDSHYAVPMGSSTSRGETTTHYEVCYVPPYSSTYDVGGTPLPGGIWEVTLSGSITQATFSLTAAMTDVQFQQQYCPASERNLNP
jgi:hypothetical protein